MIDPRDVIRFDRLTGLGGVALLQAFSSFTEGSLPQMQAFFSGATDAIDNRHNVALARLTELSDEFESRLRLRAHMLTDSRMRAVAEGLEEIALAVAAYNKVDKFSRATVRLPATTRGVVVEHTMLPGTVEEALRRETGTGDFADAWTEVARANRLRERDYDFRGGRSVDIVVEIGRAEAASPVVVDYMFRENLLGKDVSAGFDFAEGDLETLGPEATFAQSVGILSTLTRGDVPEFPDFGRDPIPGRTASYFAYGSTTRQLSEVMRSDPTVSYLRVNTLRLDGSDVFLEFEVGNVRDDVVTTASLKISD